MTKPYKLGRWATTAANVVEPSDGEKDTGWPAAFRPPASWLNWLERQRSDWARYLGGVPSGNLGLRACSLISPYDGLSYETSLLEAFPDQGDFKYADSLSNYDRWFVGVRTDVRLPAAGGSKLRLFERGWNNKATQVVATGLAATGAAQRPRFILQRNDGDYLLFGDTDDIDAATMISVDGGVSFSTLNLIVPAMSGRYIYAVARGDGDEVIAITLGTGGGAGEATAWISADNGDTWNAGNTITGFGNVCSEVAWSSALGLYCVVGGSTGYTSPDGITWTAQGALGGGGIRSVTVRSDGQFVLVGLDGSGNGKVWYTSGSGAGPSTYVIPAGAALPFTDRLSAVAYRNGRLLAIGQQDGASGMTNCISVESFDEGVTWRHCGSVTDPVANGGTGSEPPINSPSAAADNNKTRLQMTDELALFVADVGGTSDASLVFGEMRTQNVLDDPT